MQQITVICEFFVVKKFHFAQNDKNYENCLLVILYTVNIWRVFDMNENIVTRKFLTQKFANEVNANYGSYYMDFSRATR